MGYESAGVNDSADGYDELDAQNSNVEEKVYDDVDLESSIDEEENCSEVDFINSKDSEKDKSGQESYLVHSNTGVAEIEESQELDPEHLNREEAFAGTKGASKKEQTSSLSEQSPEKLEEVLNSGMQFIGGLLEMATGEKIKATDNEGRMLRIDKETGEVTMKFKLPGF